MGIFSRRRSAPETRSYNGPAFSLQDPALAAYLGLGGGRSDAGVSVTEQSALGATAVFRAVSLISGTIAQLPLKAYRRTASDGRERVPSFLDSPGGDLMTPFEFKELVMVHLLLHGNAYLLHQYNGAGSIASLYPVHPSMVAVEPDEEFGKLFKVTLANGTVREYTSRDLTHIPALGTDGLVGLSPIQVARNAIGTGLAGDKAAARMFSNGLLLGGIVTSEGDGMTREQGEELLADIKAKLSGTNNAGDIAVVNASLKFSPWTMSADDAQFLESRQYGVTEIARIFGVPKMLLAEDGASTWGSGIAELNRGLHRYTLVPWTTRIEQRLSLLLPSPRFVEFDFAGLLEGTPAEVTQNLAAEIAAGLLTIDEARRILNRPPLPAAAVTPEPAAPAADSQE